MNLSLEQVFNKIARAVFRFFYPTVRNIAQLVGSLLCKQPVAGSSPAFSSAAIVFWGEFSK
jgi:hypothetical protein